MSNNGSKPLMLMFTVGPVQSFIEAARKTEDLWMGSYILSYLVATAMKKVQGPGDVEIIYPAIGTESPFEFWRSHCTTPSFPNLFLAIGSGISQDDLATRARESENAVKAEFESMAKRVLDEIFKVPPPKVPTPWRGTYVEKIFKRQIPDFFDIYWVITEETGSDYGKWYEHTAGSLAAIKNCRAFKQISEFGRKCSLDGTREILHRKENESIDAAMKWWEDFAERKPQFCRPKEALCAVSLTKRLGRHYLRTQSVFKDEFEKEFSSGTLSFPSTSEVATAAFKEQLQCKPKILGVYADFVQEVKKLKRPDEKLADIPYISPLPKIEGCLSSNNIDGEWLYEETWDPSYLERYYNIDVKNEKHQIEHCKTLRRKIVQSLDGEPGKYYAAIALDADNMGEVNRKAEDRKQHEDVSRELIEYTEIAREIVEEKHLGKLTYAGGDDLLALANLNDLLPILKKLRKRFPKFTSASAGVCIAHNKMPLGEVLCHARRMEKAAKLKYSNEKDAFGIALFKRSGNVSEVVTKWKHGELAVIDVGMKLAKLLEDDEISKRFLYTFRDAFKKLIGDDGKLVKGLPLKEEFKRLIERAYKTKGQKPDDAKQETITETIALLPRISPFTDYLSFLEIVNFISRESK